MFAIRMGVPEMDAFWDNLEKKVDTGTASKDEVKLYKRIGKALVLLEIEPHPNDKANAYKKITLSAMGDVIDDE